MRYHVCQFPKKTDNFVFLGPNLPQNGFFGLNLGKLTNYLRYFGSNIAEGVAESWMEVEMSWVEVDGAGWRWVHGLVIPMFFCEYIGKLSRCARIKNKKEN